MSVIQSYPPFALPFLDKYGFQISYASTTTITVGAGQCRDSANVIDLVLGSNPLNGPATAAPVTINPATTGALGLDTGTFAANTGYYVHIIGTSSYRKPMSAMLSTSATAPTLPFGYDSFRVVGWVRSGATAIFSPFDMTGVANDVTFRYRTPILMTAGTSATSATVAYQEVTSDVVSVPAVGLARVDLNLVYTPTTAGNILAVKAYDGTAVTTSTGQYNFTGIVTGQAQGEAVSLGAGLNSGVPSMTYIIGTAGTFTGRIVGYGMSL